VDPYGNHFCKDMGSFTEKIRVISVYQNHACSCLMVVIEHLLYLIPGTWKRLMVLAQFYSGLEHYFVIYICHS
jgi:hypothetical protein